MKIATGTGPLKFIYYRTVSTSQKELEIPYLLFHPVFISFCKNASGEVYQLQLAGVAPNMNIKIPIRIDIFMILFLNLPNVNRKSCVLLTENMFNVTLAFLC
jgi:hypothetical protein